MNKPGLLRRLAQPRKLAAVFAAVTACGVVIASPAEARRHTYVSHHAHRGGGDDIARAYVALAQCHAQQRSVTYAQLRAAVSDIAGNKLKVALKQLKDAGQDRKSTRLNSSHT